MNQSELAITSNLIEAPEKSCIQGVLGLDVTSHRLA